MAAHTIITASASTLHSPISPLLANHSSFHGVSVSFPRQSFSFSLAARTATEKKAAVAVLNSTSNGPTTVNVCAAGLTPGDEFGDRTNGCTSTGVHFNPNNITRVAPKGVTEATIVDNLIPLSDPDTVIGNGFEVDELEDDLGRVAAVPKKRRSRMKTRIRKNIWKRKAYFAALKALSLAKSIYTGKSKSFLSDKLNKSD